MLNIYLTRLRWDLHDAGWGQYMDREKAYAQLVSITRRYIKYVESKEGKNREQAKQESLDGDCA